MGQYSDVIRDILTSRKDTFRGGERQLNLGASRQYIWRHLTAVGKVTHCPVSCPRRPAAGFLVNLLQLSGPGLRHSSEHRCSRYIEDDPVYVSRNIVAKRAGEIVDSPNVYSEELGSKPSRDADVPDGYITFLSVPLSSVNLNVDVVQSTL
jgi:hypothetical protein